MFIAFDYTTNSKHSRSPSKCNSTYSSPKNIIVYGGGFHIQNIYRILIKLFSDYEIISKNMDGILPRPYNTVELEEEYRFF